ncbi:hypothetical protein Vi05172_g10108 [Venturia inaequalis]|nr:hypothetical protein Vi05172_g10108 [Venturia inaequalis]
MANRGDVPPWRKPAPSSSRGPASRPTSSIPKKRSAPVDEQEDAWVAGEDKFALRQAKKKAILRVKAGRQEPIDLFVVTLATIDPTRDILDKDEDGDEDENGSTLEIPDPAGALEDFSLAQVKELATEVDAYLKLEKHPTNLDYWENIKLLCNDRISKLTNSGPSARGVSNVAADVDRLLGSKTFAELEKLEKQIKGKLRSNEPIDTDYWELLLNSAQVYKARSKLRSMSRAIVDKRLEALRKQQKQEADNVKERLQPMLEIAASAGARPADSASYDPEPLLKVRTEDKGLQSLDEDTFLRSIADNRRRILRLGYVSAKKKRVEKPRSLMFPQPSAGMGSRFAAPEEENFQQAAFALYEREVGRGMMENEEIFTAEESVVTPSERLKGRSEARKPLFFNRVQMGYEWNKYNQTHYDHENPPPKVVQGYKFAIFYPELAGTYEAPTYKIEREGGRKRGQSFAQAGEEDTCVIRFIAGPPYTDVAFRIIDKEWDYSAKRERGFRSNFDKGILTLSFQFKKIYYRK